MKDDLLFLKITIFLFFLTNKKKLFYFTDAPTIKLLGSPQIDLEEGKDSLVLRCEADANPPASIVWRRAGRSEIASLTENLQLRPVGRRDSGLYTCQAQNSVGTSDALSVQLDIKCKKFILYLRIAENTDELNCAISQQIHQEYSQQVQIV